MRRISGSSSITRIFFIRRTVKTFAAERAQQLAEQRDAHRHQGALTEFAFDVDGAAVQFNAAFHNHQTQSGARTLAHIASPVECFKNRRFIGLGTLPMQDTDLAICELERCKQLGLAGVQIGTNVNQLNLGEPQFFDIFAACERLGMAVFVHPWDMAGERDMQKYWLPWLVGMPAEVSRAICSLIFSGTLERLPNLRIMFAHGGGAFPATIGRIEHGFNVRPDLFTDNAHGPRKYLSRMYFDALVHERSKLEYLIDLVGSDQIAMGSDYPFPLGEAEPGKLIDSLDVDESIKEMLLNGAALNWLGLERMT